jgi:hypothetical protein
LQHVQDWWGFAGGWGVVKLIDNMSMTFILRSS